MSGLCATCKFWDTEPSYEGTQVRKCKRVPMYWAATDWVAQTEDFQEVRVATNPEDLAFVEDGSSYYAALLTRADFGCVMHSLKDGEEK